MFRHNGICSLLFLSLCLTSIVMFKFQCGNDKIIKQWKAEIAEGSASFKDPINTIITKVILYNNIINSFTFLIGSFWLCSLCWAFLLKLMVRNWPVLVVQYYRNQKFGKILCLNWHNEIITEIAHWISLRSIIFWLL